MEAILNIVTAAFVPSQQSNAVVSDTQKRKSIIKISCKPHLINTLIKESQAGVFVTDKRALLYEPAEHLSLDHERVKPLMGAVSALQEAYEKLCKHKHDMGINMRLQNSTSTYQAVSERLRGQRADLTNIYRK